MQNQIKYLIKRLTAQFGYQTDKKKVLFLSDDWGSVRLKSKEARESLRRKGIDVDKNRFDTFDCLESNDDLECLFEILYKHRDHRGNPFCFTPVTNVANPDFEAIRNSDFREYYYEPNTVTYQKYPDSQRVHDLTMEGIRERIFVPQSHAREHLQTRWWMQELSNPNSMARKVFDEEFFFLAQPHLSRKDINHIGANLDVKDAADFDRALQIVDSGLDLFEDIYGYRSIYLCPPASGHPYEIEKVLFDKGVLWFDVPRIRRVPTATGRIKKRYHYLGQKAPIGLSYLVRNVVFEANMLQYDNGVDSCLKSIQEAFDCRQPAIISNHRASFVGGVEVSNRDKGLKAFDSLLTAILKKWPEVEFVSVSDL